MSHDDLSFETRLIHADRDNANGPSAVAPIYQTSTFAIDDPEMMAHNAHEPRNAGFYTRHGNPNHTDVARVLASIEGGEAALIAASGMGAISATAIALLQAGDHVIAQTMLYAGTRTLFKELLARYSIDVTWVDQTDLAAFSAALRPNTKLLWLESPSNPLLGITDLAAVSALARKAGAITVIDSTIATPVNQQPLRHGIDLVVHSATKYLGGHSDLVAGAVVGSKALIDRIWKTHIVLGATPAPFDAWLLLRGLRTLDLRVQRHNSNAQAIAEFLVSHPRVLNVYYPGLPSHPNHAIAKGQMSGFSGLLSFEVAGGFSGAALVARQLRLVRNAVSLGGVESLIAQPAAMWPHLRDTPAAASIGVAPGLLRLSVGLESPKDLIADLDRALKTA